MRARLKRKEEVAAWVELETERCPRFIRSVADESDLVMDDKQEIQTNIAKMCREG